MVVRGALLLISAPWVVRGALPAGWPGATAAASNEAWGGHQPARLDHWEMENGAPNACWKVQVIRDVATGWADKCYGLMEDTSVSGTNQTVSGHATSEECKMHCWEEAQCPTWQFNEQGDYQGCWIGYGHNCRSASHGDIMPSAGQRIVHGDVQVWGNVTNFLILGLYNMGPFTDGCTEAECIDRCRGNCYSEIGCTYWQYTTSGCHIDAPFWSQDAGVEYPLTTAGIDASPEAVATIRAGEFIMHSCPPEQEAEVGGASAETAATDVEDDGSTTPAWLWVIFALCAFLCCAALVAVGFLRGWFGGSKSRKRGLNRGTKQPSTSTDIYESEPLMESKPSTSYREGDLFDRMDVNHDGKVSKEEFIQMMTQQQQQQAYQQQALQPQPQQYQQASFPQAGATTYQMSAPSLVAPAPVTYQPGGYGYMPGVQGTAQAPTQVLSPMPSTTLQQQAMPTHIAATAAMPTYQAMPGYR